MVTIESNQDTIIAYISGDIDHHSAKEIRERIDNIIEIGMPSHLVLDFKNVTFMDSSGIGLVMGRYKLMNNVGGDIKVSNTSSHIKKVMKLAGLDKLAVFDD